MFNSYMTMYNAIQKFGPMLVIAVILFVIASRIMLRFEMHRMRQLESDIRSERAKLMHERAELERKYHMYM